MKSIQWVLNILFAIILGYLLINSFSNEPAKAENVEQPEVVEVGEESSKLVVRYINSDSIYAHYEMVNDLRKDLESRQKQYSSSLEARVKAFEQEVITFQQNAQTMSQFEGQQKQKELLAKEQELGAMQQDLSSKLLEMENKMQRDIRENVLNYLESFKSQGVDLVLDFSSNSSLLMAQDTFDISSAVIDSLNVRYAASKSVE